MMEYALGLHPRVMDTNDGISFEKSGNIISLIHPKNRGATDLKFEIEHSTDLTPDSWSVATVNEEVRGSSGEIDIMKASMNVSPNETKHFMRISVQLIPTP